MIKKLWWVLLLVLVIVAVFFLKDRLFKRAFDLPSPPIESAEIYGGVGYVPVDAGDLEISVLSSNLASPTRIKITPDGQYLLVTLITGEVVYFPRTDEGWDDTPKPLVKIETKFPGFPPDEAGLVGLVFSTSFSESGKVFLLYTFKDGEGKTQNRISVTSLKEKSGQLVASKPKLIFQANVEGSGSHQITDGIAVDILERPHLLFLIGEGFKGERAQDPALEGGKMILIQEDGSDPLGTRPYPENPRVQALGIRNGFVMAENPDDEDGRILISDTGPDRNDRLIYTLPLSKEGADWEQVNFNWDGSDESLEPPIGDPNFAEVSDMVILRLPETRTFTGIIFHPGKGVIPVSTSESQSVLATVFGKTGSTNNKPGKEIWLGTLGNLSGQPQISFNPIIERNPEAEGKLGNPIGLELDQRTGDFFFADILEGKLYWVKVKDNR